jgi:hypothetical protein
MQKSNYKIRNLARPEPGQRTSDGIEFTEKNANIDAAATTKWQIENHQ